VRIAAGYPAGGPKGRRTTTARPGRRDRGFRGRDAATEDATFTLADRIPVSENKEIRIDKVSITPGTKPDSQGLLHWDLTLKAGEKREFRIAYQLEYPAELVIETNRRQMQEKASPSAPSKARIEDQIKQLEDEF
jgi:hypothetical protein